MDAESIKQGSCKGDCSEAGSEGQTKQAHAKEDRTGVYLLTQVLYTICLLLPEQHQCFQQDLKESMSNTCPSSCFGCKLATMAQP